MAEAKNVFTLTAPVVMIHPQLFEPRAFGVKGKEVGEKKYSAGFMFDPTSPDLTALKTLTAKIMREARPHADIKLLSKPWTDGNMMADRRAAKCQSLGKPSDGEFQRGKVIFTARSKFPVLLAGIENGRIVDYETEAARLQAKPKFYFGVQVLAEFNLVWHDEVSLNAAGVNAYLNKVLTLNKGEKLTSSTASAAETFKGYVGTMSAEDPTAGAEMADTW